MIKPDVTGSQLAAIVHPLGAIATARPLSGGMFATVFDVTLVGGVRVVVKITSTDDSQLCRYERGVARTEARVFRSLLQAGLPVPDVLLTDFTHNIVEGDVVVTSFLPGMPWADLTLDDGATADVKHALGALMARLHEVPGQAFGYPEPEAQMQAPRWRDAFELMVKAIVADAADTGTELPVERIRMALQHHGAALDAVQDPVVVHNDLWPANVFLDAEKHIVGVIDTERTVWADPLLDLVGADQFGLWDVDPDLIAGNSAAGGVLAQELASETGPTRFALYRLYFSLILVTEITVRKYEDDWVSEHRRTCQALLDAALTRLGEAAA